MSPEATYLLQSLGTVAVFGGVAWLVVSGLRKLGVSTPRGPLQIVARTPLDGRRSIYLVRVGARRVIVVGASDAGLSRLGSTTMEELGLAPATAADEPRTGPEVVATGENDAPATAEAGSPRRATFGDALSKVLRPVRDDAKRER
jgi:flagellar biogenesis protein FliO